MPGRTLTLAQKWQLCSIIVVQNANRMRLPFALWNRRTAMELIKAQFDIDMPIRTVGKYLLRWGNTPPRPMKRALERNPLKIGQWLNRACPRTMARARAEGATI